jgi:transcriptional regulator NrdR family protein
MVCIYCGENTRTLNSRLQKRTNQTWRRRQCLSCKSIVTTLEHIELTKSLVVINNSGETNSFVAEKLFLSIYESLKHRPNAINDAKQLSNTVTFKLINPTNGRIQSKIITEVTLVALNRFDKVASAHYSAFHHY